MHQKRYKEKKSALDEFEESTCTNGTSDGTSSGTSKRTSSGANINTEAILEFCLIPRTRAEIQSFCEIEREYEKRFTVFSYSLFDTLKNNIENKGLYLRRNWTKR